MEDHLFRCKKCKEIRPKRRHDQQYCRREACQKARKNSSRRAKYEADPDYRANQRESTKAWLASQGGAAAYYRRYRRWRKEQRRKKRARRADNADRADQQAQTSAITKSANSDAKTPQSCVISGRYRLSPCDGANSDAILVELSVIPTG